MLMELSKELSSLLFSPMNYGSDTCRVTDKAASWEYSSSEFLEVKNKNITAMGIH